MFIKRAIKGIIFSACLLGWAGISHGQSVVAPTQIIVGDDSQYNLVSANGGAVTVTGFDPAGVRISVAQGNVRITMTTGLTAPGSATSADWTGACSIAFEGTLADINAALASLEVQGSVASVSVIAHAGYIYGTDTGSSYQLISATVDWPSAKADAEARSLNGVQGHLATITSQAELNAIINNLDWSNHVWLGGSDSVTEGEWFWVTGPEAGTQFYSDNDPSLTTFENFRSDQPSNSIGGQHHLTMMGSGVFFDQVETRLFKYIVEYDTIYELSASFSVTPQAEVDAANLAITINSAQSDLEWGLNNYFQQKLASHLHQMRFSQISQISIHQAYEDEAEEDLAEFSGNRIFFHKEDMAGHFEVLAKVKQAAEAGKGKIWSATGEAHHTSLKNGRENMGFSSRLNYDWHLHKKIAHRAHIGLETSQEQGGYIFRLRSQTDSISAGYGLSYQWGKNLFASLHGTGWYSLTRSKYARGNISAKANIKTAGGSVSARMQGSYQLSPDSWLDLMIAYIRAREAIQDKRIFITSPGYQSLNHLFLSEPETIRLSLEPVWRIILPPDSNNSLNQLKLMPNYRCEKMKAHSLSRKCNKGMRIDFEVRSQDDANIARLYYDFEDLANGPVYEYGMALDVKF